MRHSQLTFRLIASLFGLSTLFLFIGCTTGSEKTFVPPVQQPIEDVTKDGSLSGSVYSLALDDSATSQKAYFDYPYGAEVTLEQVDESGQIVATFPPQKTYTTVSGGYQFPAVPKGLYKISAHATSPRYPGVELSNSITGVEVKGGLPTLMANLIIGDTTNLITVTGTVTQDGMAPVGAIVTIEAQAEPFDRTTSGNNLAIMMSVKPRKISENACEYSVTVPRGADKYYVYAYSNTSDVSPEASFTSTVQENTKVANFTLTTITDKPYLPTLSLFLCSNTLPAATVEASQQSLITRMAVARILNAPPARIAWIEKLAQARRVTRSATPMSMVENDLTWESADGASADMSLLQGYHLYRSATKTGQYTQIGSALSAFQNVFADNDPALALDTPYYYSVASFAANGALSTPSAPALAKPLPQFTGLQPANEETVTGGQATLRWDAVAGARGYILLVYRDQPPTFNATPDQEQSAIALTSSDLVSTITAPGTYWWSISAYNVNSRDALYATSTSYSAYRKLVVLP